MLSWKEIVQNYIVRYSDKIKKTTRVLREQLQVTYFTYHRIDHSGKYTVLVDRPDWAEHYVNEKFFLDDPYLRHPDVYESGFCLLDSHGSDDHKERVFKEAGSLFQLDQNLLLIEKSTDAVEFFGFSGNQKTARLDKLYLNHPWVFKSFANHFKREMRPVLSEMERDAGSLLDLKGNDFLSPAPVHPGLEPTTLREYLKVVGNGKALGKIEQLSSREKQCIQMLLAGKSAKETALHLGLSHRTIEAYFENIKNKLSCSNKTEILHFAKQFEEMGLF